MKLLVIRFASAAEIIQTSPLLRCLKNQVPGLVLHFLCDDKNRAVAEFNPHIDKLHVLAHSYELMKEELKTEGYDFIIDLQHNNLSRRLTHELQVKTFLVKTAAARKKLYTRFKINLLPHTHLTERFIEAAAHFGINQDGGGLDFFIPDKEETTKKDIPASHYAGYIIAVIGADYETRKWPVEYWKEFCTAIDHPVILVGHPGDAVAGNDIAFVDDIKVYNACGKFSMNETADLISKSKLVISTDSVFMHMAAAFKKPLITLWGNSTPAFGEYPWYGKKFLAGRDQLPYEVIEAGKLWCRPCSTEGFPRCPRGHFKCMKQITPAVLLAAVKKWL